MVRKKVPFWKIDLSQPRFLPGGAKFVPNLLQTHRRLAFWIALILVLVSLAPGIIMLVDAIASPSPE